MILFGFATANGEIFTAQRDNTKFTTRHTAGGILSSVDGTASLLGFLPQDMLGRKIMEFYHPEDMLLLKDVYETIMAKGQTAGASFCGKPYRFLAHNGCYITVETEWSSFVNPWSHHLEFVIGYHRVLRGPMNPNVLASRTSENVENISEDVMNKSRVTQDEILKMLTEPVIRQTDTIKQKVSQRCQVLASYMETLMDEVNSPELKGDLKLDLPIEVDLTFSERDSVMLGEISPHHEYFDSKSSSEAPPSYNQLNYSENLQRFFDSRPLTTTLDLEEQKMEQTDTEPDTRANVSSQCFGESGCSGNTSSASNANMERVTNTSTSASNNSSFIPLMLTEALLSKHNDDMEKLIIKRHKVSRTGKSDKNKKGTEKSIEQHTHGLKRSVSHSWEGEAHKTSKQQHIVEAKKTITLPTACQSQPYSNTNVDLWPPFSVSLTTIQNSPTTATANHFATSNIIPTVYYIPQNVQPQDQRGQMATMQYMPSVLYQPMMYPLPSTFYQMQFQSSIPQSGINESVYTPAFQFEQNNMAVPVLQTISTTIGSGTQNQSTFCRRPSSQATSVKADIGSTSASVANRVRPNASFIGTL